MGSRVNPPTRWVNPRNLAGWWVGGLTGWRVRKPQPNPRNFRVVSYRVCGSCQKLPPLSGGSPFTKKINQNIIKGSILSVLPGLSVDSNLFRGQ